MWQATDSSQGPVPAPRLLLQVLPTFPSRLPSGHRAVRLQARRRNSAKGTCVSARGGQQTAGCPPCRAQGQAGPGARFSCTRPALPSLGFLICKVGGVSYSHRAQLCAIKQRKPLFPPGRSGGLTRARGDAAHTRDPAAQNQAFLLPLPSLGDAPPSLVVQLQGWSSHSPSPWPLSQPLLVSSGPLTAPTTQLLLLRPPLNPMAFEPAPGSSPTHSFKARQWLPSEGLL